MKGMFWKVFAVVAAGGAAVAGAVYVMKGKGQPAPAPLHAPLPPAPVQPQYQQQPPQAVPPPQNNSFQNYAGDAATALKLAGQFSDTLDSLGWGDGDGGSFFDA